MSKLNLQAAQNKARPVRSIQSQYISTALLLGGLVLIGATLGYLNITSTSSQLIKQAETTSNILELTTEIREHASSAYNSIQAFILDPDQSSYKDKLNKEINRSLQTLNAIKDEALIKQLDLKTATQNLALNFESLHEASRRLFVVRVTANEQYPALAISSEKMRPLRLEIISAINLTTREYHEDHELELNTEEYYLLNEIMLAWVSTLAEYRLYLTNRMGSFDPVLLLEQEVSVDSHADRTRDIALRLVKLDEYGHFGFEGSNVIKQLPELITLWQKSFASVKAINHSGKWRMDSTILDSSIIPLMDAINEDLKLVDMKVKQEYQKILKNQTSASTKQNYILIGIILLFLLYIIISIKLLQHFIIKPIAIMASAMKDEAQHHNGLESLKLNKTRETQDLIDAFNEMNRQVYKRQNELEHQAMHDSLTGLPNRLMLQQRLEYHLLIADRDPQNLIFMMLDLNRFKEINDTLGHHIGDSLLIQVGERILKLLRHMDTVARLGGDEFAILLPDTNREQAANVADKINQSLAKAFYVNGYELQVSVSIGISEFPSDSNDSHTLMQHADVAMYISKREKSDYHFYSAREDSHSIDRLSLGADLKSAIENNQLILNYQPKYLMTTGKIIGAEALLRWQHPVSGNIAPEQIINLAEEMGIIHELSHWVISNAMAFCAQNIHSGYECSIAINLSAQNLRDPKLLSEIKKCLQLNKLNSSEISFEITESAMMSNPEKSIQVLNKLHQLGVKLSVDDFGTGFSSLAYLKLLPVNELKIDKSFVIDMEQDESDRLIVHSTIELSHNLGLKVVAEGIENKTCWDMLLEMGCDTAQGYYMSEPIDKDSFSRLLETSSTLA
ncbi:MAG: bifunctional diguanylate cyclase/phosphodiesterase [Gammaproteobacteria bacterium]|nr:bifunctional diguanylate cyclase/phosphodiesterase [Gammaproteobacteria bacterium]